MAKRSLRVDAIWCVLVNLFLVVVWAISGGGYFWPIWIMGACAIYLLFRVFLRKPITQADIDEELRFRGWLSGRPAGNPPTQDDDRL